MLFCRQFQDRTTFIERCRDTLRDDRGLVIPIEDDTIIAWLSYIHDGQRHIIDESINQLITEVWLS